jgi:hypothetical protein
MPIKINRLQFDRGESIMLLCGDSLEMSLHVEVTADGRMLVSGPFNCNSKTYEVTTGGLVLVPKEAKGT